MTEIIVYCFGILIKSLYPFFTLLRRTPSKKRCAMFPTIVKLQAFETVISGNNISSFLNEVILIKLSKIPSR